jgi:hypothetical protein
MNDWRRAALEFHRVWQPQWVYKGAPKAIHLDRLDGTVPLIGARAQRSSIQTIGNDNLQPISFSGAGWDRGRPTNFWAGGTPTRMTAPSDGFYKVGAIAPFDVSGAGAQRQLRLTRSDGQVWIATAQPPGVNILTCETLAYMFKAQYFEAYVYQDSGGDLNLTVDTVEPAIWIYKVGSSFDAV